MGFCFGVRDAIEVVRELGESGTPIYTLGAIVHNPQVADELRRVNVTVIDSLDEAPDGSVVAITAHGAPPDFEEQAERRGLKVVDTTCPLVTRIQKTALDLVKTRHSVLVYGDASHKEVKGIVGWSEGKARVIKTPEDLDGWEPTRRVALIAQSTSNTESFREMAKEVVGRMVDRGVEVRVINTICKPTKERQAAVRRLARDVDVVLAVGGEQSANTRKLVQAAEEEGARAYQVVRVEDVRPEWFEGAEAVGITAGASTPDWVVDEVEAKVRALGRPVPVAV
ncbi:MAG TPA: 4-hydroxy-3-methylbut-2-enyl diphosphate reductase [Chloroflexota bacterium]|jgi:4-hydroxy-3-methylbut-2-enyl diphosphate reductase|nr:4-hydroxy-3-methylbut-2-enyl diphosphate reductase [Chloroflexota bacterium]